MEELKQILADFKWTFENMGTPHTPDHFNIPANAITQLEKIIAASPSSMPDEISDEVIEKWAAKEATVNGNFNSDVCHDLQVGARWMRSQCEGLIKQKAVEFAMFIHGKTGKNNSNGRWYVMFHGEKIQVTTEELYEIFNQQER